jgi:hypothetical protein
MPNGIVASAPTSSVVATSSPIWVSLMPSAWRSSVAEAPTVATSAPLRPSTAASTAMTRARRAPPRMVVTRSAAVLAASAAIGAGL